MDILEVIRTQYAGMSRAQKKIADYILNRPEDACFASLKELTEAVGVTEVTMVNFARRLGVDGFSGLKRELQGHIRRRLSPNQKIARAVETVRRRKDDLYSAFLENELADVSSTYAGVPEQHLHRTAALIRGARRVYLLGYDISVPVVHFLRLRLHYLGFNAVQLDLADKGQLLLSLSQADASDAVILASFPAHAPEMERIGEYLHGRGVPFAAIVDQPSAPVALYAELTLACVTDDPLFYNTITAAVSLVNVLCACIAMENEEHLRATRRGVEDAFGAIFQGELPASSHPSDRPGPAKE